MDGSSEARSRDRVAKQDDVAHLNDDASNLLVIDGTGQVTGNIVARLRSCMFGGAMNAAKDRIVGRGHSTCKKTARPTVVGVFALLKATAVARRRRRRPCSSGPPASAPKVTEGGTATLIVDR